MPEQSTPEQLNAQLDQNPNSYWALRGLASARFQAEEYEEALELLERLDKLDTFTGERSDPIMMMARCYRELEQTELEIATLQRVIGMSSDSLPALRRLIELAEPEQQWDRVADYANQINAINPLVPDGHTALADAAENLDQPEQAAAALKTLNLMDPLDPAEIDFRLATNLAQMGDRESAKHFVMRALEQAPRYRAAHRLLLDLAEPPKTEQEQPAEPEPNPGKPESEQPGPAPAEPEQPQPGPPSTEPAGDAKESAESAAEGNTNDTKEEVEESAP